MCGIFGYIGRKHNATKSVFSGLKRLEYRGYDSWGIGVKHNSSILVDKHAGKISEAKIKLPPSFIAIGHTRWATHGGVNDANAHPHFSSDRSFILAHNGIVENYQELKNRLLKKGLLFKTETDTEVIVRLVEAKLEKTNRLQDAVREAFLELEGRNTIIILSKSDKILTARKGSPLVIGVNDDLTEIYLSSDTLSFAPFVKKIIVLDNDQMAITESKNIKLIDVKTHKNIPLQFEKIDIKDNKINKEGFKHFMIREINESPFAILRIVKQNPDNYRGLARVIKKAKNVYTIGSGTAGASAAQIAFYLRKFGKINAVSLIGAEAREYCKLFGRGDLIIAPSQSGETADVLEILEHAQAKGVKIASLVNMPGSMMTRISNYKFMSQAGPEICVMSTKIFISHLAWGYLIAKAVQGRLKEGLKNLNTLFTIMKRYLKNKSVHLKIRSLAKKLARSRDIFLLGKSQNLQIIKEGMIKIIEGSYIHAHALPAGDLKHYAITLIEEGIPVIFVLSNDSVKKDIINAINEVKTRGAEVIGISPDNHKNFDFHIKVFDTGETSAIINIIPLQLLAYYMADELKHNVDKPRNIAKSVTVK